MYDKHTNFLNLVANYAKENPDVAAYVSDAVAYGLQAKLQESCERAADMEVALAVMVAKRYKGRESLVLNKLEKWNGKSSLNWDDTIEMLKEIS